MKNYIIHISAFNLLDSIATQHGVKAKDWAAAAWGNTQFVSRISELRKLYNQYESGVIDEDDKVGRVLSADKLKALFNGLKSVLKGDVVKKELIAKLATVKTEREKNLILIMVAEEDDQKAIRLFIQTLIDKGK